MKFNIYIDESGDTGISKLRTVQSSGASPFFVLGAVVCQPTAEVFARNALAEFRQTIGRTSWKHATELDHAQKVLLARELGRLPVRYFALISNKSTLNEYKELISKDPHKFYNKCSKYLLECICKYLAPRIEGEDDLAVVFEKRNHDYDAMRRYLLKVRDNPIHAESKFLKPLNPFCIVNRRKGEEDMLELADFVAHSVYQCCNLSKSNYGIPEPRYFLELSSRFAGNESNKALGVGLKCIHSLEQVNVEPEIARIFNEISVVPPPR